MRIFPKVVDGYDSLKETLNNSCFRRKKAWIYGIFSAKTTLNQCFLKYVFPTKQEDARRAVGIAERDSRIARLIVFGSAVTDRCGQTSDLDIAVDAPGVSEDDFAKIARGFWKAIPSEFDIVDYNNIRSDLLKNEIDKKVIVIYAGNK